MIEIIYFIPILAICLALGSFILEKFSKKISADLFFSEYLSFSAVIGFAMLIYITFFLGVIRALYSWVFYILFITLLVLLYTRIKKIFFNILKELRKVKIKVDIKSCLFIIIFIFVIINLIVSTAPVVDYDSMLYHLAIPKIYARHHSLLFIPDNMGFVIPESSQMLYLSAILIKDGVLAKLYPFSFGFFLMLFIYSFTKRFFSGTSQIMPILAALLFYTMSMVTYLTSIPSTDLAVSLFSFAAFYSFFFWVTDHKRTWLYFTGIFSGLAASSKLSAISIPLIIGFGVLFNLIKTRQKILKSVLILFCFLTLSLVVMLPWYARSFILTGNPVFPLFCSLFRCSYWNSSVNILFISSMKHIGMGTTFLTFILLPWNLTMNTLAYDGVIDMGPIFLAFIPIMFFLKKKKQTKRVITYSFCFSLIFIISWFYFSGVQVMRYLLPIFSLLVPVCAYTIVRLYNKKYLKWLIFLIICFLIFFSSALSLGVNIKKVAPVLNLMSDKEYYNSLKDYNPFHAFDFTNKNLPKGSKILLFKETRGYYSDHDFIIGAPHRQAYVDYDKFENYLDLYTRLKEIGVTHIMVNDDLGLLTSREQSKEMKEFNIYLDRIENMIEILLEKKGELIYNKKGIRIYTLK